MITDANIDLHFGKGGSEDLFFYRDVVISQPIAEMPDRYQIGGESGWTIGVCSYTSGSIESTLKVEYWPMSAQDLGIPELFGDIDALIAQMESGIPLKSDSNRRRIAEETAGSDFDANAKSMEEWAADIAEQISPAID